MATNVVRRKFVAALGGAAIWPLAARGQQPNRVRRIGVLMLYEEQNAQAQSLLAAFQRSLADRGWVAGRNIMFEKRWAGTDPSRVDQGAKELVAIQPELIISSSSPTTIALLRVTRTIPIIFIQVIDPVGQGFAASMSHPALAKGDNRKNSARLVSALWMVNTRFTMMRQTTQWNVRSHIDSCATRSATNSGAVQRNGRQ